MGTSPSSSLDLVGDGDRLTFVHLIRPSPKGISAEASRALSEAAPPWLTAGTKHPMRFDNVVMHVGTPDEEMGVSRGMAVSGSHGRRLE